MNLFIHSHAFAADKHQNNMANIADPNKSLEWYVNTLNTTLPAQVLYEKLMPFYDQLAAAGVNP